MENDKAWLKDKSNEEMDSLFQKAIEAAMEEEQRSLRDPAIWKDQVLIAMTGVFKGLTIIFGTALLGAALLGSFSIPDENFGLRFGFILGLLSVVVIAMIYPRFLFRNLFKERAGEAFDRVVHAYKGSVKRH